MIALTIELGMLCVTALAGAFVINKNKPSFNSRTLDNFTRRLAGGAKIRKAQIGSFLGAFYTSFTSPLSSTFSLLGGGGGKAPKGSNR